MCVFDIANREMILKQPTGFACPGVSLGRYQTIFQTGSQDFTPDTELSCEIFGLGATQGDVFSPTLFIV